MGEINFKKPLISEPEVPSFTDFFNDLRNNPNNCSVWFPLTKGCNGIPPTVIVQVPEDVVKAFFMEHKDEDRQTVRDWVEKKVMKEIPRSWEKIFIKNGCFSNKFNFKSCTPELTVDSITDSVIDINYNSFMFDTGGASELVIRKYIEYVPETERFNDKFRIYNGLPLRRELRIFYDFDNKKAIYSANYWCPNCCREKMSEQDLENYDAFTEASMKYMTGYYREFAEDWCSEVLCDMQDGLTGIWSADFMYNGFKWYLIDMAVAEQSAYYDPEKIRIYKETGEVWCQDCDCAQRRKMRERVKKGLPAVPFFDESFTEEDARRIIDMTPEEFDEYMQNDIEIEYAKYQASKSRNRSGDNNLEA